MGFSRRGSRRKGKADRTPSDGYDCERKARGVSKSIQGSACSHDGTTAASFILSPFVVHTIADRERIASLSLPWHAASGRGQTAWIYAFTLSWRTATTVCRFQASANRKGRERIDQLVEDRVISQSVENRESNILVAFTCCFTSLERLTPKIYKNYINIKLSFFESFHAFVFHYCS